MPKQKGPSDWGKVLSARFNEVRLPHEVSDWPHEAWVDFFERRHIMLVWHNLNGSGKTAVGLFDPDNGKPS